MRGRLSLRAVSDSYCFTVDARRSIPGPNAGRTRKSNSGSASPLLSKSTHARSTSLRRSLRLLSRATTSCPLTHTLHTSLTPPAVRGSIRATLSPHQSSASHPTATSSRKRSGELRSHPPRGRNENRDSLNGTAVGNDDERFLSSETSSASRTLVELGSQATPKASEARPA
jgi:hypothetical protein